MTLVVAAGVACKWFVTEVANALWRKLRSGEMTSDQAAAAVGELPGFFDDLVPCVRLAARSLALAADLDQPVHDCLYLALAELREANLVTADQRPLARLAGTPWASRALSLHDLEAMS